MRRIILLLILPLLMACEDTPQQEQTQDQTRAKACEDCTASDFPGGPNTYTANFCAAAANCVGGNQLILEFAANDKCKSLNTGNCTGTCPGSSRCEGILNPNSNWAALQIAAVAGAACPGVNQVMCAVTVTIPAGQKLDCKCSCNP